MRYTIEHIARIIHGEFIPVNDTPIENLLLDSRKVYSPGSSLFFALKGFRRDGIQFIQELYDKGVRNFVVSQKIKASDYPGSNIILVKDTLAALQRLAGYHREQFTIPVIGITGSNGKTIVKEWLYQLLHMDYNIVRSPKSYNSQIGVPLSVWQMNDQHTLAIFEAGISKPGEMERLEKIIQPTIGLITNIGEAHGEGFESIMQKEKEKKILFNNARQPEVLEITAKTPQDSGTKIVAKEPGSGQSISIEIPFTDEASVQNAITCWQLMLLLGYDNDIINFRMKDLVPVNMRLELKKGINGCTIINDSYSADLSSLDIALNFLNHQKTETKKTVILSDFLQSSFLPKELYRMVLSELTKYNVNRLIGIGEQIVLNLSKYTGNEIIIETYTSTEEFIKHFRFSTFKDECILVKGARIFSFERIVQLLEQKAHQTVLEVNLSAIIHNLKAYQQHLQPATKVMAMVKAFAYGSGGAEIAGILQYHKVDYLGVAYADEGVDLRKAGITLPVMVMNTEENAFESIVENNLEPELFSFELLHEFDRFLKKEGVQQYPVHLEIETGMNRLGFAITDIGRLVIALQSTSSFKVKSVFSHLVASEEKTQDEFTYYQFTQFENVSKILRKKLGYDFISHVANSAAAIRLPELQMDMVRLGIGLYGVDTTGSGQLHLQTAATLKSTVAQIKYLQKGDSVGYNRKSIADKNMMIATIRIGYADGFPRRLGNGVGCVLINGKLAPLIGTVCMDMFMIDITSINDVKEGDEVIIFGKGLTVQQVATRAQTIPYEIMTGISQRVKRVYFEE